MSLKSNSVKVTKQPLITCQFVRDHMKVEATNSAAVGDNWRILSRGKLNSNYKFVFITLDKQLKFIGNFHF